MPDVTATASIPKRTFSSPHPLFDEMRRAEHRERIHLAPIHQLAQDQAGLDRLADADIVRDEQRGYRQAKGHQQGYELVGPGFEGELRGGPERAGAAAQRQAHCIREQRGLRLNGRGGVGRQIKSGRLNREDFKLRVKDDRLVLTA